MVHSEAEYKAAVEASGILFGSGTHDALVGLDEDTLLDALKAFDFYARMAKEPDAFNEVYELLLIELYVRTEAEDPQAQDDDDTGRTHGRRRRKRMRS